MTRSRRAQARPPVGPLTGCAALRRRRLATNAAALALAAVLIVWSITPIYNMVMVSLEADGDVFGEHIWPAKPSLGSFWIVITQGHWYLEDFWHQFGNSLYIGAMTTMLTLLIGSLTSFSVGRMRVRHGWLVTNAALLDLRDPGVVPGDPVLSDHAELRTGEQSMVGDRGDCGLRHALCDLYLSEYGRSIPIELDESARIDGASPCQIYFRIYLPLMAPALVAIGTYACCWHGTNFLYQFLLLSSKQSMTVPVAIVQFLNSDESPWNYMMATAIIYAIPPVVIYYGFRRRMAAGLTMGGVKG